MLDLPLRRGQQWLPLLPLFLAIALLAPARANAAEIFRVANKTADAHFVTSDGCLLTQALVFAVRESTRQSPGPQVVAPRVFAVGSQFDTCNGFQLLREVVASSALPVGAFSVSANFDEAHLDATVPATDHLGNSVDLHLDVTWIGGHITRRSAGFTKILSPGGFVSFRSAGAFRSAQAVGTVSDGQTDFTPAAADTAFIGNSASGQIAVSHGAAPSAFASLVANPVVVSDRVSRLDLTDGLLRLQTTDATGCVVTDVLVEAQDRRLQQPPGPWADESDAFVSVFRADLCADVGMVDIAEVVPLQAADFQTDNKLGTASLRTTFDTTNHFTDMPITISVDVTWLATGDATREIRVERESLLGFRASVHSLLTHRPHRATGTISDGPTNYLTEAAEGNVSLLDAHVVSGSPGSSRSG